MSSKQHRNALQPGHRIHWYEIKQVLGQGGFGITYLAFDPNLEKHVAIKEYLPSGIAVREGRESVHPVSDDHGSSFEWGLERFIAEARTLSKFKHPNIVHVLLVTEENNTAYMVMEYEEGESLHAILRQQKTLPEPLLLQILLPILDGLELVHQAGFIHRDIKPANIYIRKDGSPVLLDFGSARQALGEETKTLTTLISPGYAPFEQYFSSSSEQGEWSDIYALGATCYRAVTGIAPQEAVDRSNAILKTNSDTIVSAVEIAGRNYSLHLLKAIDHALAFRTEDRPQTISAWRKEITVEPAASIVVRPPVKKVDPHAETVPGTEALHRMQKGVAIPPETLAIKIAPSADTLSVNEDLPRIQPQTKQSEQPARKKRLNRLWLMVPLFVSGLLVMMLFVFEKKNTELLNKDNSNPGMAVAAQEKEQDISSANRQPVVTTDSEMPFTGMPQADQEAEAVSKSKANANNRQTERTTSAPSTLPVVSTRRLLQDARYHMNAGRLLAPPGLNAFEKYQQILKREPDNKEARKGMEKIARTVLGDARTAANNREYDKAQESLYTLRNLFPNSVQLDDLINRMKRIISEKEKLDLEKEKLEF